MKMKVKFTLSFFIMLLCVAFLVFHLVVDPYDPGIGSQKPERDTMQHTNINRLED